MRGWREGELLLEERRKRRLFLRFPYITLLFVMADEPQKLHQRTLCTQIEGSVGEDVLSSAGYTTESSDGEGGWSWM